MNREPERNELERYFVGELDEEHAARIRKHAQSCPECSRYLENLEAERIRFLNLHPFEEFAGKEEAASRKGVSISWIPKSLHAPAAVVAFVMLFAPIALITYNLATPGSSYRYKGNSSLTFHYKRDGLVHKGVPSDTFQQGDQLQIQYSSESKQFVSLFSVDNQGAVSFYHPDQLSPFCSMPTDTGNSLSYPASILLDETEGEELIVVLLSETPVKTDEVIAWVRRSAQKSFSDLSKLEKKLSEKKLRPKHSLSTLIIRKKNKSLSG
ncbi:MAG: anti-sigma factor family protein [Chitinispirillaceae bacterium]